MKRKKLKVIHDDQLEVYLKSLDLYYDYINGKLKCKFCQCVVDNDNLAAFFPVSGSIKVVCDKPNCLEELSKYPVNI